MLFLSLLAYIDPGVGSIVFQAVIAIVLSTGVVFRRTILSPFACVFRAIRKQDDE